MPKRQSREELHSKFLRWFDIDYNAVAAERKLCLDDRRFYAIAGAPWEGALGADFVNKPKLEANKAYGAVRRVLSSLRRNQVSVDFVSKDGSQTSELADVCDSLYRADAHDSVASEAHNMAQEEAAAGGFGAWRLRAGLVDEYDGDEQTVFFDPIPDADQSVFFDANAKRKDKADAKRVFCLYEMTKQAYEDEYGEDNADADWPTPVATDFDWGVGKDVRKVAELFVCETITEKLRAFQAIDGSVEYYSDEDFEEDPELETQLLALGGQELERKKKRERKVRKYILSGSRILKDEGYIAGSYLPIVPLYCDRIIVQGTERCIGVVRWMKDLQRLTNMQLSKLAEIAATSGVDIPIFLREQIAAHQTAWVNSAQDNPAFLTIDPATLDGKEVASGPVGMKTAPQVPAALGACITLVNDYMIQVMGENPADTQIRSNVSGDAVEMIQGKQEDNLNYLLADNYADAMKHEGRIWLSMKKDITTEDNRKMKAVGPLGDVSSIVVNGEPIIDEETGDTIRTNDLSEATFDVAVDVGPASTSRRNATARILSNLLSMGAFEGEDKEIITAALLQNIDIEGAQDINEYFRKKMVRKGIYKPTEEDQKAMAEEAASQKPDPNTLYLEAEAENARSKAILNETAAALNLAKAEETKAKILEIAERVALDKRGQFIQTMESILQATRQPQKSETKQPTAPAMGEGVQ